MIELNVEEWLKKLESQITLSKKGIFNGMKQVDEGACLECISQIRALLPSELSEARLIKKDSQNIIAQAQAQANKIVQDAQLEAQRLVEENRIVEDAKAQANKIIQDATDYANSMVGQAYSDMAKLFNDAELHARDILQVVMDTKAQVFPGYDQNQQPSDQQ